MKKNFNAFVEIVIMVFVLAFGIHLTNTMQTPYAQAAITNLQVIVGAATSTSTVTPGFPYSPTATVTTVPSTPAASKTATSTSTVTPGFPYSPTATVTTVPSTPAASKTATSTSTVTPGFPYSPTATVTTVPPTPAASKTATSTSTVTPYFTYSPTIVAGSQKADWSDEIYSMVSAYHLPAKNPQDQIFLGQNTLETGLTYEQSVNKQPEDDDGIFLSRNGVHFNSLDIANDTFQLTRGDRVFISTKFKAAYPVQGKVVPYTILIWADWNGNGRPDKDLDYLFWKHDEAVTFETISHPSFVVPSFAKDAVALRVRLFKDHFPIDSMFYGPMAWTHYSTNVFNGEVEDYLLAITGAYTPIGSPTASQTPMVPSATPTKTLQDWSDVYYNNNGTLYTQQSTFHKAPINPTAQLYLGGAILSTSFDFDTGLNFTPEDDDGIVLRVNKGRILDAAKTIADSFDLTKGDSVEVAYKFRAATYPAEGQAPLAYTTQLWIDWDGDGKPTENDEFLWSHDRAMTAEEVYHYTFIVPSYAKDRVLLRARLMQGYQPIDSLNDRVYWSWVPSVNGEVEDYLLSIKNPVISMPIDPCFCPFGSVCPDTLCSSI